MSFVYLDVMIEMVLLFAKPSKPRHEASGEVMVPAKPHRRGELTRRGFLSAASGAALGLAAGGLLSGCADTTTPESPAPVDAGPGGIPLARPDQPVTLPLYDDNTGIESGLQPEAGPLLMYNWIDYVNPTLIKSFERKYGATVKITHFTSIDEAISKLTSGSVEFDVAVPGFADLPRLVAGKVVRPLNLDYIPNLKANVWPLLTDPWYDRGSRYSVPYGMLSTGISWRADKLPDFDPAKLDNPYDAFWQATDIKGKVGMLDDQRDALAWTLLGNGVRDVNTGDPALINKAGDDLTELIGLVNLKFGVNDWETLPSGALWLHQSWSGNMILAKNYLPKGTSIDTLRYWWPSEKGGVAKNDLLVTLRGGKNPVLAHLFLNHLLDSANAVENFSFTGFQQPVRGSEPDALVKAGLVPPNLRDTSLTEVQLRNALVTAPLSQSAAAVWQDAWSKVKAAA